MKKTTFLVAMFALMFVVENDASAQGKLTGIATGADGAKCTPKVGDDVELAAHDIQSDNSTLKKGRYFNVTVIQGGTLSGTSIKGGSRMALTYTVERKAIDEIMKAMGRPKFGMVKITKVSGTFSFSKGDDATFETTGKTSTCTISRKGKVLGSFTIEV